MLCNIPGNAGDPLNPSVLLEDGEHGGMDLAHAPVWPDDAVLLDDRLAPQDALGGLESSLPVLRVHGVNPLAAVLNNPHWSAPDPLEGGADVFHLQGFGI